MTIYVVIRYAPWPRPLISDCLFSVAVGFAFPPWPFPLLINLNEIPVLRQFHCSNNQFPLSQPGFFSSGPAYAITPGRRWGGARECILTAHLLPLLFIPECFWLLAFGFNGAGFSEFKIPNAGGHWAIYRNLEIEHIIAKRASGSGGAADMHRAPGPRTVKQLG